MASYTVDIATFIPNLSKKVYVLVHLHTPHWFRPVLVCKTIVQLQSTFPQYTIPLKF